MKEVINYDYFYIRNVENEILGHYYTSDSDKCYRIFRKIDEDYGNSLSFEQKEMLFFDECKKENVEIHLFNNSDRYTY